MDSSDARPGAPPRRYYVYVIELDDTVGDRRDPKHPSVYVGQSAVPPAERFRQHKEGYRSSRHVRKHGKHLRPGLYRTSTQWPRARRPSRWSASSPGASATAATPSTGATEPRSVRAAGGRGNPGADVDKPTPFVNDAGRGGRRR